eukprot:gene3614-biopygen2910
MMRGAAPPLPRRLQPHSGERPPLFCSSPALLRSSSAARRVSSTGRPGNKDLVCKAKASTLSMYPFLSGSPYTSFQLREFRSLRLHTCNLRYGAGRAPGAHIMRFAVFVAWH